MSSFQIDLSTTMKTKSTEDEINEFIFAQINKSTMKKTKREVMMVTKFVRAELAKDDRPIWNLKMFHRDC